MIAIGSSTGGPQALTTVLKALPATVPVPIVIVQHMPPVFTKHLADRLNQESALTVKEAQGRRIACSRGTSTSRPAISTWSCAATALP